MNQKELLKIKSRVTHEKLYKGFRRKAREVRKQGKVLSTRLERMTYKYGE